MLKRQAAIFRVPQETRLVGMGGGVGSSVAPHTCWTVISTSDLGERLTDKHHPHRRQLSWGVYEY